MQCPRCDFENADRKTYCDRCGTLLSSFTPYSPEYGMQSQAFSYQKLASRPRITVLRVVRSILYFIGVFIAAVGLLGTFNAIFGTGPRFEGLAIFFGICLLVGGGVIFIRMLHRPP